MEPEEFRKRAHELVDWMADYAEGKVREYPVCSSVKPKDIIRQLPEKAPEAGESFDTIFRDFENIIMPGITHWQHPKFFAYFPANASPPSLLAEMLMSTLGAQCMVWQTSPAAAELEERVLDWLAQAKGLPSEWHGVIQDTASTATLCSLLTAREEFSEGKINTRGFENEKYICYCSDQTHSSIEKAVKIAGIGSQNLRYIQTDDNFAMKAEMLEKQISKDLADGFKPLWVTATVGTTGSTAVDPLREIGAICKRNGLWLHVDAAFSGTAALLPEKQNLLDGIELADTYVFNPHKWMLTNFDCSAYYVKDKKALLRTFEIMPEYLKTGVDSEVNNYRDWGVPLGRRFRALKLWFVLRSYGLEGIRQILRKHLQMAETLAGKIHAHKYFEVLAPLSLNLLCFRFSPEGKSEEELNVLNKNLLDKLNAEGEAFLTHTKLRGKFTIRMCIGQTNVNEEDVEETWLQIQSIAAKLISE